MKKDRAKLEKRRRPHFQTNISLLITLHYILLRDFCTSPHLSLYRTHLVRTLLFMASKRLCLLCFPPKNPALRTSRSMEQGLKEDAGSTHLLFACISSFFQTLYVQHVA